MVVSTSHSCEQDHQDAVENIRSKVATTGMDHKSLVELNDLLKSTAASGTKPTGDSLGALFRAIFPYGPLPQLLVKDFKYTVETVSVANLKGYELKGHRDFYYIDRASLVKDSSRYTEITRHLDSLENYMVLYRTMEENGFGIMEQGKFERDTLGQVADTSCLAAGRQYLWLQRMADHHWTYWQNTEIHVHAYEEDSAEIKRLRLVQQIALLPCCCRPKLRFASKPRY